MTLCNHKILALIVFISLFKGQQAADSILRISLDDLTNAEKHGRWWLVGSAWSERTTDNKDSTAISGEWLSWQQGNICLVFCPARTVLARPI